jgi:hypothetical protein
LDHFGQKKNWQRCTDPIPRPLDLRHVFAYHVRLPRIELRRILWPPNDRYLEKLSKAVAHAKKENLPLGQIDLTTLEPPSFSHLFEPPTITEMLHRMLETPLGETVAG